MHPLRRVHFFARLPFLRERCKIKVCFREKGSFAISDIRKTYLGRLVLRCAVLLGCIALAAVDSEHLRVLEPGQFFRTFSPLHLLWAYWVYDMLAQLFDIGHKKALGSRKVYAQTYQPAAQTDKTRFEAEREKSDQRALLIFVIWSALTAVLGFLHQQKFLTHTALFLVSVFFYVCDLICVLIWCPFRLMLGNRCCTTCRIFNWDHAMMFSPLLFVGSFFALTLAVLAALALAKWEWTIRKHPERFSSRSNAALQCVNCTDKLCTQYCEKCKAKEKTLA